MFGKAIERAEPAEDVKTRVLNLIDFITYSVHIYTSRGLFEKDKLIFVSQMCLTVITDNYSQIICLVIKNLSTCSLWLNFFLSLCTLIAVLQSCSFMCTILSYTYAMYRALLIMLVFLFG